MMSNFFKSRYVGSFFVASLALVAGGFAWALAALSRGPALLIIHYNGSGITELGTIGGVVRLGIAGLCIIVVDFSIAAALEERDWFWGKCTATVGLFLAILIFIAFAAIIQVN